VHLLQFKMVGGNFPASPSTCPPALWLLLILHQCFAQFNYGPLRTSSMSESCHLRGLRHCLTLRLRLAVISLPWGASFLSMFNIIYILHRDGRCDPCDLWPWPLAWCPTSLVI